MLNTLLFFYGDLIGNIVDDYGLIFWEIFTIFTGFTKIFSTIILPSGNFVLFLAFFAFP